MWEGGMQSEVKVQRFVSVRLPRRFSGKLDAPEHMSRLSQLCEPSFQNLPLRFQRRVALLHFRGFADPERQQKRIQIASIRHKLKVICRPA